MDQFDECPIVRHCIVASSRGTLLDERGILAIRRGQQVAWRVEFSDDAFRDHHDPVRVSHSVEAAGAQAR